MGSDLNYSDMTSKDTNNYNYKLIKETMINKQKVWLIESKPRTKEIEKETGYKKSIIAVRQDNYVIVKAKLWTYDNKYIKYISIKKLEKIDGIWLALETHIVKKQDKRMIHQTLMKQSNVKFNQNLDDNIFTIRKLEKGL